MALQLVLHVLHGVSAPSRVVHMHKTYAGVELLSLGVALVYEQTYCRQSQGACLVYGSLDELRGNALAAVLGLHTEVVYQSLAFLRDGREPDYLD